MSEATRRKKSEAMAALNADPEFRRKSDWGKALSPAFAEASRARMTAQHQDPAFEAKRKAGMKRARGEHPPLDLDSLFK